MYRFRPFTVAFAAWALLASAATAQDGNILLRVPDIEQRMRAEPFEILDRRDSRFEGDRTQRVLLTFSDSSTMIVKWARSAEGGQTFNNQPRYELAAYELQKLFLDESDLVVPPTVARAFSLDWYRTLDPNARPTFRNASSVLVVLQYWLASVTNKDVFDERRLQDDTAYARHLGNLNVLTYLIRHSDSNLGNVLMSTDSSRPRLFSVDNGVAFDSPQSDRGILWRSIRTRRLPASTVERLRQIRREDLDRALSVVAQFEIRDGEMVAVPPTEPLSRASGVRRRDNVLQLGLTSREISGVETRLRALLKRIDDGNIQTF